MYKPPPPPRFPPRNMAVAACMPQPPPNPNNIIKVIFCIASACVIYDIMRPEPHSKTNAFINEYQSFDINPSGTKM